MAWLYQRPDSERWWIGFRQNGKQILRSTKTSDKGKAEQQLKDIEAMLAANDARRLTFEVYQELTGTSTAQVTLKKALDNWLTEARGAAGPRTVEKYKGLADAIIAHFHATEQGPHVSEITRQQLQEFLTKKRESVSASTTNLARKCLSIFFRYCKLGGYCRDNPVEGIKQFKASRAEEQGRRPFTMKELGDLYKQAPDEFWRYLVLAGFFTGLRLGDLATMPIGAVDLKERIIKIRSRKTGEQLYIPIAPPLYKALANQTAQRHGAKPSDPLWPEQAQRYEENGGSWFSQRFYDLMLVKAGLAKTRPHRSGSKKHSEKRNVNEVSFHCFRYSYVSTLAALGHNQQIVKALAGHSSDEVNDLYTKVPAEVLRAAVKRLPDFTKGAK